MIMAEMCALFGCSRRTVMRMIDEKKIPRPVEYGPMSWDRREVKDAHKKLRDREGKHEQRNGRKHRKQPRDRDGA